MGPYYRASAVSLTTADYARCQALYEGTQGGAAGARSGGSSSCCGVCGPRYARLVQREGADSSVHVVKGGRFRRRENAQGSAREQHQGAQNAICFSLAFSILFFFSVFHDLFLYFKTGRLPRQARDRLRTVHEETSKQPTEEWHIRRCCTGGLLRLAHAVVDAGGGAVPRRSRWLSALHGRKLIVSRCQSVRPSALTDCC